MEAPIARKALMAHTTAIQEQQVNSAFSKQSAIFDEIDEKNPIIQWMRSEVRAHMLQLLHPHDSILELNAGTGLDAIFFAEQGYNVHAVDIADGMLNVFRQKVHLKKLQNKITIQQCSFNNLQISSSQKYNHLFSNFGGLNCASDIEAVIRQFDNLLAEKGMATLVMMPPICLWEMSLVLKGNFKTAFRRFNKKGAVSHLEGNRFMTYYYSPFKIISSFGSRYKLISLKGLGVAVPPPYLESAAIKNPKFFQALISVEKKIAQLPLFRSCGDHYIITMQKK